MSLTTWKLYFIFCCTLLGYISQCILFLLFYSTIVPLFYLCTLYLHSLQTWSCHFLTGFSDWLIDPIGHGFLTSDTRVITPRPIRVPMLLFYTCNSYVSCRISLYIHVTFGVFFFGCGQPQFVVNSLSGFMECLTELNGVFKPIILKFTFELGNCQMCFQDGCRHVLK